MEVKATQADAYRLLHQGILALGRAERQGMRIDREYCKRTKKELTEDIKSVEARFKSTKFYRHWKHASRKEPNINSNAQLGWFLYKVKKLKSAKKTATGQGATDEEALLQLGVPEIDDLLRIRKLKKIRDTYLDGFLNEQVRGYIHPNFNLHIARTFRSSSSSPNFQNIPKRDEEARSIVRNALYPRPGHMLLEVDYSGIEVGISACYHKDPTMLKYIKDPASDMHGDMAEQIFLLDKLDKSIPGHKNLRSASKNGFVFPQFYGDYYVNNAQSLACSWGKLPENKYWKKSDGVMVEDDLSLGAHLRNNSIKSLKGFTDHLQQIEKDFWERRFRVYAKWKEKFFRQYQINGYIEMLTGFRCYGPMAFNDATNYPIQGSAFHCLLWAFIEMDKVLRERKLKTRLIGQIHDAMVLDVHPDELDLVVSLLREVMIERLMEHWKWIIVPLEVEIDLGGIDESWEQLKSYEG